jgi:flagellar hook-basal body complex protein FliE
MIRGIQGPQPIAPIEVPRPAEQAAPPPPGTDFGQVLGNALKDAAGAERSANDAATRFAAGDPQVGIHEVVIAAEKASISVRYAVTLKNRAIEAYRELLNTPV